MQSKIDTLRQVSIHAPVKDATFIQCRVSPKKTVSIHAPVKDATERNGKTHHIKGFQSTHP